ncbi:hypothetical protein ABT224_17405 [Streptomyces sp. NPDC001584]|uniref:effector-associated constant component EACC1 n=1 Tax=Streptomyces sp. NPDC001584 TaxID=3154521 RepID=UPI00331D1F72
MSEYALRVDPHRAGLGPETELRSLLLWLSEDEALRRDVRGRIRSTEPAWVPASASGTPMGSPGFDLLQLAVGSGLSTGSLVFAVLQWQASRRRPPALTVRRGPYEVTLTGDEAGDPEALHRIVAALENGSGEPDRDGDDDGTA